MARGDANWTAVNELEHWGWMSFELAFDKWRAGLRITDDAYAMDYYDQHIAFIECHSDGWPPHPDAPVGLCDGLEVRDLRVEMPTIARDPGLEVA